MKYRRKTPFFGSFLALFLSLFWLSGCASITDFLFPEALDKDARVEWRKELKMEVNGKVYRGLGLTEFASIYEIKIYPGFKEIDRLQWRTCHREDFVDKAVENGFWPWSKKDEFFKFEFRAKPIELNRSCPLRFESLTMKHKTLEFGMLLFPDSRPWINLPASVECNGQVELYESGKSICQAPANTVQKIRFSSDVVQDETPNELCPPMKEVRPGEFEFFMPENECVYIFGKPERHESGEFRKHILTTFGYEKIPPPEDL